MSSRNPYSGVPAQFTKGRFSPENKSDSDIPDELEKPMFSRAYDPHGKCNVPVKVDLPEQVNDDLAVMAGAAGVSKAEYLRRVINQHLYGGIDVIRSQTRRNIGMPGFESNG